MRLERPTLGLLVKSSLRRVESRRPQLTTELFTNILSLLFYHCHDTH
jgi:hypothetical protein